MPNSIFKHAAAALPSRSQPRTAGRRIGRTLACMVVAGAGSGLLPPAGACTTASNDELPLVQRIAADATSRFALHGLVIGLLDDSASPRWRNPSAALACSGPVTVLVEGRPLRPGAEMPSHAFDMEWLLAGCKPFGPGGPRLTGRASGTVFFEEEGLALMLRPNSLYVVHGAATQVLRQPAVSMSLDCRAPSAAD